MDQTSRQSLSMSKNKLKTYNESFHIYNFARSWLGLDDREIQFLNLRPSSFHFTIPFPDKREISGTVEATGNNGYFTVTSSIELRPDGDRVVKNGCNATINCHCLLGAYIAEEQSEDFCAKETFQSQMNEGKESFVSVRFSAKGFLDKVAKLENWNLTIVLIYQLRVTQMNPWRSVEIGRPLNRIEPPFLAALRSKAFADVTIECNGRTLQAHKNVLACVSTVFARMFETSMAEASTKTIKIDDQDPSTIQHMLEFIYTGDFAIYSDDALVDQLYCAEKYDLGDLKAAALLHMVLTVCDSNVIKFIKAAMDCNAERDALGKFFKYCRRNFASLSKKAEFKPFFAANFDEFFSVDDGK